jgi:hypothetical protein
VKKIVPGNNNDSSPKEKLLGRWKKITDTKCSKIYPDYLEFTDMGMYTGKREQETTVHPYWDAGTYQILNEDQVKISTANDAQVIYNFSIIDGTLIFMSADKCEFKYLRIDNE